MNQFSFSTCGLKVLPILILLHFIFFEGLGGGITHPRKGLPFIQTFGKAESGAGAKCNSILHDHRGLAFIGNELGILEFDGKNWTLIESRNHSANYSICQDDFQENSTMERPANRIYAGFSGDFGYLTPDSAGRMSYVSLFDRIPQEFRNFTRVYSCHSVKEGIVFNTNEYLFLFREGKIIAFPPHGEPLSFHYSYSLSGELYVAQYGQGLWKLNGDKLERAPKEELTKDDFIMDMEVHRSGINLVLTHYGGLFVYDETGFHPWEVPGNEFLKGKECMLMDQSPSGQLAIQTLSQGIIMLDINGKLEAEFNEANGRSSNGPYDLIFDSKGNLWIAHQKGVSILELSSSYGKYDEHNGLPDNVYDCNTHQGYLYVCSPSGVFASPWQGKSETSQPDISFLPVQGLNTASVSLPKVKDQLYCTFFDMLGYIDGSGTGEMIIDKDIGNINSLIDLSEHPGYLLGTGTSGVLLFKHDPSSPSHLILKQRFTDLGGHDQNLVENPRGTFWTNHPAGGYWRFGIDPYKGELTGLVRYTSEAGLPISALDNVYAIGGEVVFSTHDGLYRYQEAEDRFYPDSVFNRILDGRPSIMYMSEDHAGNIWVWSKGKDRTLDNGSARLQLIQPRKVKNGIIEYSSESRVFLRIKDFLTRQLRITHLENGDALLASSEGLLYYNASSKFSRTSNFEALIRKVELIKPLDSLVFGGAQVDEFGALDTSRGIGHDKRIPYHYNSIRFTFSANYLLSPEELHFQYFLEGYDKFWSAWTPDNKKEYSNLREGKYTFHVRARNVYQTESLAATYTFRIAPPWHRTLLAYGTYLALAIGLVWIIVKLNSRRLQKDKERLEKTIEVRTEELRESNQKLLQLNEFKQGMTSMIVHDLKNPLNNILNPPASLPGKNRNQIIMNAGKQMLNMVMNILDVDKYEESQMMLKSEEHGLSSILETALSEVDFLIHQKNISVSCTLSSNRIVGDYDILVRVLVNLITNAVKYTPPGGFIRIASEEFDQQFVRISVEDTGEGIPAEKMHQVFQKFGQVMSRKSGNIRSTGLGLTFCKMAVEAHGGTIDFISEVGKGSTFWFTLKKGIMKSPAPVSPIQMGNQMPHLELSSADRKELLQVATHLSAIPIFSVSKIRKVLKEVDPGSEAQEKWIEEVKHASTTVDQSRFKKLLQMVSAPSSG